MIDTLRTDLPSQRPDVDKGGATGAPDDVPEGQPWVHWHLLLAAVSGGLMTTFRSLAAESDLEVVDYIDEPSVRLVPGGSGGYRVERMTLRPRVLVSEKSAIDKALRLLDKAQRDCPVARSIGARVWVVPRIEGDVPQAVRRQMGVAVPGTSDPVTTSATSTS